MRNESFFSRYFPSKDDSYSFQYPHVKAKLTKRTDMEDPNFLTCSISYKGLKREYVFFDEKRLGGLSFLEYRDRGKVDKSFFSGEIGERLMRATVNIMFDAAELEYPDFSGEVKDGKYDEVLARSPERVEDDDDDNGKGLLSRIYRFIFGGQENGSEHNLEMRYGRIGNVYVYALKEKIVDGKIKLYRDPSSVRSEVDVMADFSYNRENSIIICEAKTSTMHPRKLRRGALKQLTKVGKVFPDVKILYLLMAQDEDLFDTIRPGRYRSRVKKFQAKLRKKGFESMFFPFPEGVSKDDMEDCGKFMADIVRDEVDSGTPVVGMHYTDKAIKLRNPDGNSEVHLDQAQPGFSEEYILEEFKKGNVWLKKK